MTDDRELEGGVAPGRPGRSGSQKVAERAPAEYALLGLIAQNESGEIHGYDLARSFANGALGRIVRLEPGMLYHYLKKLAKDGLIASRIERQSGRPDRQVHTLTPAGNQALRGWITAPVGATREIRLEFLVKLYLARQIDPGQAVALVAEQQAVMRMRTARLTEQIDSPQAVMRMRTARLTEQIDSPQADDADSTFGESVLRLRLTQTQAALDWLDTLPESGS